MLTVLRSACDWLEYSCKGSLAVDVPTLLEELKGAAQETGIPQAYPDAPLPLYVARSGLTPWAWVLKADELHVRLSDKRGVPAASVRSLADGLAAYGHEGLFDLSRHALSHFGELEPACTSRVDIAVDFQGWTPTEADMDNIVCRAAYHGTHGHHRKTETFQFGQDVLAVRIYNKTAELRKSGSYWLLDAWATAPGYEPGRDTWRFEAQLRRDGIQSFGVKAPADVLEALPSLLASMLEWCSLRIPQGKNRSRWPVDPRWEELATGSSASVALPRVRERKTLAHWERTAKQMKGLALSAGATRDVKDFERLWTLLGDDVARYIEEEGGYPRRVAERKAERTGRT